jgi:hypothetical protein
MPKSLIINGRMQPGTAAYKMQHPEVSKDTTESTNLTEVKQIEQVPISYIVLDGLSLETARTFADAERILEAWQRKLTRGTFGRVAVTVVFKDGRTLKTSYDLHSDKTQNKLLKDTILSYLYSYSSIDWNREVLKKYKLE